MQLSDAGALVRSSWSFSFMLNGRWLCPGPVFNTRLQLSANELRRRVAETARQWYYATLIFIYRKLSGSAPWCGLSRQAADIRQYLLTKSSQQNAVNQIARVWNPGGQHWISDVKKMQAIIFRRARCFVLGWEGPGPPRRAVCTLTFTEFWSAWDRGRFAESMTFKLELQPTLLKNSVRLKMKCRTDCWRWTIQDTKMKKHHRGHYTWNNANNTSETVQEMKWATTNII